VTATRETAREIAELLKIETDELMKITKAMKTLDIRKKKTIFEISIYLKQTETAEQLPISEKKLIIKQ
jgi:hypothetical protein